MKSYLLLGKGGVGKTTLSAALGLALSQQGNTRVLSLDPAHNLFDILTLPPSQNPRVQLTETLIVEEVDLEQAFQKHFSEMAKALQREYRYLQPLGLDRILNLLKEAPGSEEFIYLQILLDTLRESSHAFMVYDFPPTGLALRILSLPIRSRHWAERLLGLRKEILELRETIARIRKTPAPEDPVIHELITYHQELERLIDWLRSEDTEMWIVAQEDPFSIAEARDILIALRSIGGQSRKKIIANRVVDEGTIREVFRDFPEIPLFVIPPLTPPPIGQEALQRVPGLSEILEA